MKVRSRLPAWVTLFLLAGGLTACAGPGYYLQAVSGHLKLMHARQDIQSLLNDPATGPDLAERLETANGIRAFAKKSLGLPGDDSYSSYVAVEGDALVWNVVVTREFSLEPKKWCFPVAGCVPYRGYFKQQKAEKSATGFARKGMDVYVSPATAYSSLGWFSDPLLSTMLSGSTTRLAAYLFHELAHQRLYVRGDGRFNEGYASFVEETGVRAWLLAGGHEQELENWQQARRAASEFGSLVAGLQSQLAELYRSGQAEPAMREHKAALFESFRASLNEKRRQSWQGRPFFSSWSGGVLNNARLALYSTYEGSRCAFQRLWLDAGEDMEAFHRLADRIAQLPRQDRTKWLNQSCEGIARTTDL